MNNIELTERIEAVKENAAFYVKKLRKEISGLLEQLENNKHELEQYETIYIKPDVYIVGLDAYREVLKDGGTKEKAKKKARVAMDKYEKIRAEQKDVFDKSVSEMADLIHTHHKNQNREVMSLCRSCLNCIWGDSPSCKKGHNASQNKQKCKYYEQALLS